MSAWPSAPGLFNIGAQGQAILGAIVAAYIGFTWHLPPGIHLLLATLGGLLGGAFWGGIVGWLKAKTGAHEVIVTIMMNYIAAGLLAYLLTTAAFQRPGPDRPDFPDRGLERHHAAPGGQPAPPGFRACPARRSCGLVDPGPLDHRVRDPRGRRQSDTLRRRPG